MAHACYDLPVQETVQATNRHALSWAAYDGVYRAEEAGGAAVAPGTVFRLSFLGSVELDEDGGGRRRKKRLKKTMVEEAVTKIKVEFAINRNVVIDLVIHMYKFVTLLRVFTGFSNCALYPCIVTFV